MPTLIKDKEIKNLRNRLGCSQQEFANMVNVGIRTISRWEHNEAHPRALAIDKLYRLRRLAEKIQEIFETEEDAVEWLNTPNDNFNGRTPLDEIAYNKDEGIRKIINLIGAFEHGIYT